MNKIYLAGPWDDDDFAPIARALREREWDVQNSPADLNKDFRHQARMMLDCQAACFMSTWWTNDTTHALQLVAGMARLVFIHPETFEVLTDARP